MTEFKCDKCGKVFNQEKSLQQHVNDKHVNRPPEQKQGAYNPGAQQKPEQKSPSGSGHTVKVKLGRGFLFIIVGIVVVVAGGYGTYAYFSQPASSGGPTLSSGSQVNLPPIGPLGGVHFHADFALFLDGEEITPLGPAYFVRAPQVHVESGPGAGTVTHIHAANVPLGFFFRTLGMTFNENCFVIDNGEQFCNDGEKTLKMFVRGVRGEWEQNFDYQNYIPGDLDQVLITYGDESEEEILVQQSMVTGESSSS